MKFSISNFYLICLKFRFGTLGEVNPGEKREFGKAMVHRVESEEGKAGGKKRKSG